MNHPSPPLDPSSDPEDPRDAPHPSEAYYYGAREPWNEPHVAHCACGWSYRLAGWARLPLVGTMRLPEPPHYELRDCICGSTIAREVP